MEMEPNKYKVKFDLVDQLWITYAHSEEEAINNVVEVLEVDRDYIEIKEVTKE